MPIVQKCYFCYHRVYAGLEPACVEVCPAKARVFGDLNDPKDEVTKLLSKHPFQTLKPEMGTYPQVYYIAADADAMDPFAGRKEWT
jgi:tetrathionate reductase subunit B